MQSAGNLGLHAVAEFLKVSAVTLQSGWAWGPRRTDWVAPHDRLAWHIPVTLGWAEPGSKPMFPL